MCKQGKNTDEERHSFAAIQDLYLYVFKFFCNK